jgi:phage shock protein PspC (stress-responsive transcriptional regulator)/predicted membrane protein
MSEHTITTPQIKRLERSRDSRIIAGVAGGLGRYFDIAPAVFRLGFIVLTLLGGSGVLVYIAAVLVMPKEGEETSMAEDILRKRRDHPARLVALGLIAVAILSLLAHAGTWPTAGASWFLVLVAGLVLLWTGRRRGIVIAITTVLALVATAVVAAIVAAFAWFNVSLGDGVGDRTYTPSSLTEVQPAYKLGVGHLVLDLSGVTFTTAKTVDVRVGVGRVDVTVPRDVKVLVDAHAKAGSVNVFGQTDDGRNASVRTGDGRVLRLDVRMGAGDINVDRAT